MRFKLRSPFGGAITMTFDANAARQAALMGSIATAVLLIDLMIYGLLIIGSHKVGFRLSRWRRPNRLVRPTHFSCAIVKAGFACRVPKHG